MRVCFDFETHLIDRCQLAPRIVCAGRAVDGCGLEVQLWQHIKDEIIEHYERDEIVNARIAFDSACTMADDPDTIPIVFGAYRDGRVRDPLLQEKMIDIALGVEHDSYSQGAVAMRRLGRKMDKESPWRKEYASLQRVPVAAWPKGAVQYVLDDVTTPLELDDGQQRDSAQWAARMGSGLFAQSPAEAYASLVFYLASCWGVRTDPRRVGALELAVKRRLDRARGRLVKVGLVEPARVTRTGKEIPPKRNTKAAKALIAKRWEKLGVEGKLTDGGDLSLDRDACTLSGSRVLELYSEYSTATTTMARVNDLKEGVTLPLQASFDTLKDTYRTSSFKPKEPVKGIQMQNFGKKDGTRDTLTPRPGHVFIVADVASMEAHYWAQFCLDMGWGSALAEMLNAGKDMHRALGALFYEKPGETLADDERDFMKPGNYGFLGGMGVDTFILTQRKNSGILYERGAAEKLKAAWLKMTAPSSGKFFAYISELCRNKQNKGTLCHPSTGVWRTADYCSLANFTFQHPSAIGVKRGLNEISYECYSLKSSDLYGARLVNAIHDEGVAEVREEQAAAAAERFGKLLCDGVNSLLPDVPTKVPPLICRKWSKGLKPKRVEGRLVCSD